MRRARGGYKLYECYIDATFARAKGGGDGIGCTKAGKGVKIMVLVDARGLPVAVETMSAAPHESRLAQGLFDFMLTTQMPLRVIGDKAYDSDALDQALAQEGVELIAAPLESQVGEYHPRRPAPAALQAALDRRADDFVDPEFPPLVHSLGKDHAAVSRLLAPGMHTVIAKSGFGIGSSVLSH
ncbi:MAG: transposase [Phycisphaerae bacterium]